MQGDPIQVVVRSEAGFFVAVDHAAPSTFTAPSPADAGERGVNGPESPRLVIHGTDPMDHHIVFTKELAWGDRMFQVPLLPGRHLSVSAEISGRAASLVDVGMVTVPMDTGHDIEVTLDRTGSSIAIMPITHPRDDDLHAPPNPLLSPLDAPTILPPPLPPLH
jgi:hypothetical protein